eukprot:TRINITY_DN5125_c0_g1_i1.p1 TRINITY_DN5125_c0_g1~~TRINITY_DN5125_c0_g1_i1.p1  ORF type:complete len:1427 (+),score=302.28 TRINITY_DN5125_c0_g1_i1:465-4283(+)
MIAGNILSIANNEVIFRADSRVVQFDYAGDVLLVSTLTKTMVLDTLRQRCVSVGTKPREGLFGACFHPALHTEYFYCARPGNRLWLAERGSGKVASTLNYKAAMDVPAATVCSDVSLDAAQVSSTPRVFGKLLPVGPLLLSWTQAPLNPDSSPLSAFCVLNVEDVSVPFWHCDLPGVLDVAARDDTYFVLLQSGASVVQVTLESPALVVSSLLFQEKFEEAAAVVLQYRVSDVHVLSQLLSRLGPSDATAESAPAAEDVPLPIKSAATDEDGQQDAGEAVGGSSRSIQPKTVVESLLELQRTARERQSMQLSGSMPSLMHHQQQAGLRDRDDDATSVASDTSTFSVRSLLAKPAAALSSLSSRLDGHSSSTSSLTAAALLAHQNQQQAPAPVAVLPQVAPQSISAPQSVVSPLEESESSIPATTDSDIRSTSASDGPPSDQSFSAPTPSASASAAPLVVQPKAKVRKTRLPDIAPPSAITPSSSALLASRGSAPISIPSSANPPLYTQSPASTPVSTAQPSALTSFSTISTSPATNSPRLSSSLPKDPAPTELLQSTESPQVDPISTNLPLQSPLAAVESTEPTEPAIADVPPQQPPSALASVEPVIAPAVLSEPAALIQAGSSQLRRHANRMVSSSALPDQAATATAFQRWQQCRNERSTSGFPVKTTASFEFAAQTSSASDTDLFRCIASSTAIANPSASNKLFQAVHQGMREFLAGVDADVVSRGVQASTNRPEAAAKFSELVSACFLRQAYLPSVRPHVVHHQLADHRLGDELDAVEETLSEVQAREHAHLQAEDEAFKFLEEWHGVVDLRLALVDASWRNYSRCVPLIFSIEELLNLYADLRTNISKLLNQGNCTAALELLQRRGNISLALRFLPALFELVPQPAFALCVSKYPLISRSNVRTALLPSNPDLYREYLNHLLRTHEACRQDEETVSDFLEQHLALKPQNLDLTTVGHSLADFRPQVQAYSLNWQASESLIHILENPSVFAVSPRRLMRIVVGAAFYPGVVLLLQRAVNVHRTHRKSRCSSAVWKRLVDIAVCACDKQTLDGLLRGSSDAKEWLFALSQLLGVGTREQDAAAHQEVFSAVVHAMVVEVGAKAAVEAVRTLPGLASSVVCQQILISAAADSDQAATCHAILEAVDSYLWKSKGVMESAPFRYLHDAEQRGVADKLPFVAVLNGQTQLGFEVCRPPLHYLDDIATHWGVDVEIARGVCVCCTLPVSECVGSSIVVFPCGHAFHQACVPEQSCISCLGRNLTSFLSLTQIQS